MWLSQLTEAKNRFLHSLELLRSVQINCVSYFLYLVYHWKLKFEWWKRRKLEICRDTEKTENLLYQGNMEILYIYLGTYTKTPKYWITKTSIKCNMCKPDRWGWQDKKAIYFFLLIRYSLLNSLKKDVLE